MATYYASPDGTGSGESAGNPCALMDETLWRAAKENDSGKPKADCGKVQGMSGAMMRRAEDYRVLVVE
ncbi:MAG: hypothetical protein IKO55_01825 [Kiritimatiellae bacterium]|nr:hypothetical protein [Kiritimatiellia bacterium]